MRVESAREEVAVAVDVDAHADQVVVDVAKVTGGVLGHAREGAAVGQEAGKDITMGADDLAHAP